MTAGEASGQARVLARFNRNFIIETSDGTVRSAVARRKFSDAVCGDRIEWQMAGNNSVVITAILDRRSLLSRPDRRGRLKPVAANIDQIVIVNAPAPNGNSDTPPHYHFELLDQYLVAAENLTVDAVIVVNKSDLLDEQGREHTRRLFACYQALDYPFLMTSTRDDSGMTALIEQLRDKTSIFVGESGTGKSSLIHNLLPDQDIRTGHISELSGHGRHTTTTTMLYHLPLGGHLIDSPGVREYTLGHINSEMLLNGFREFAALHGQCRYRNCRHVGEAGCHAQDAAAAGVISERRLQSYRRLQGRLAND